MTDVTPRYVSAKLAERAEEIVQWLLPQGRQVGNDWCVGSVRGEPGNSTKVCLSGDKVGRWSDFAAGDKSGDLLDLIAAVNECDLGKAIKDACEFLGIERTSDWSHKKRQYVEPKRPENARSIQNSKLIQTWLTARHISNEVADRYKLIADGSDVIVFPYFRNDKLLHLKFRSVREKKFWSSGGTEPCLFGWHALAPGARAVILTEGEADALAFAEYGLQAMSIPFGAGKGEKHAWIENEWEHLERFDIIYLAMDMDGPGAKTTQEVAERLGRHRIKAIKLPRKDANQCLMEDIPRELIMSCVRQAKVMDPPALRNSGEYTNKVIERFHPTDKKARGFYAPWLDLHDKFLFEPGCVTIISGYTSHGKALALDTPIATPSGWATMGSLSPGDVVYSDHGKPVRVIAATPVQHDRPCYSLTFSGGETIVADAEHLWKTRCYRVADQGGYVRDSVDVRTTSEIYETRRKMDHPNHLVDISPGLQNPSAVLPVDPYLLGLWLGDGHKEGCYITSRTDDAEISIAQFGGHIVPSSITRSNARTWSTPGLLALLREAGVLNNKHIPGGYLRASYAQRLALLQGLMDTDGYAAPTGQCEYTSVREVLADDVLELVRSLGIRTTRTTERATLKGRDVGPKFRVCFTPGVQVFRLARKAKHCATRAPRAPGFMIKEITPASSVPVRCIQVEGGMFLAGRSMVPTHNSQITGQIVVDACRQGELSCVASLEFKPDKWLARNVCQVTSDSMPTKELIVRAMEWMTDKMWVIDTTANTGTTSNTKLDDILAMFEYAYRRYGVKLFVIDPFLKLGIGEDDLTGQSAAINKIHNFAVKNDVHVLLVHHFRKTDDDAQTNTLSVMSLRGAAAIGDLVDNVILCWRNKPKERRLRDPAFAKLAPEEQAEIRERPDTILLWDKTREGDELPRCALWFDRASKTWVDRQGLPPTRYLKDLTVQG